MAMTCEQCEAPIDPKRDFRKVEGYERIQREGGGTNAVFLRKVSEVFRCSSCLKREQRGISTEQTTLL